MFLVSSPAGATRPFIQSCGRYREIFYLDLEKGQRTPRHFRRVAQPILVHRPTIYEVTHESIGLVHAFPTHPAHRLAKIMLVTANSRYLSDGE